MVENNRSDQNVSTNTNEMSANSSTDAHALDKNATNDNVRKASTVNGVVGNDNVEQTICSYIKQSLLPANSGIEISSDDDLLSMDYLDSMQFMRLAQFVEETYVLKIPAEDLLIENFQTVGRLGNYISERLLSK